MTGPSVTRASPADTAEPHDFALYHDAERTRPTPYHSGGAYFAKARDRMNRTYALVRPYVKDAVALDIGASPFYLLHRMLGGGARRAIGVYFANDDHPLRDQPAIHSRHGKIELSHCNAELERLPLGENEADVVTACEILEHFDMFPSFFAHEVRRVLKPGGYLAITVPNVASVANILKLIARRNIYYPYRADHTGRHKHEYTKAQLKAFIRYLGMDVVKAGYLPSPTSDKFALRPFYRLIAALPGIRGYSPVLYILARQPDPKPESDLDIMPPALFDHAQSIED